ncbi:MAG: 16S rRNA (cytosine(1402)-N(4))-methyltransferase RsmH, partial [Microgenomates group bacterium]
QDPEAIAFAAERFEEACPGLTPPRLVQANFKEIESLARENGFDQVDGILFDLGVSSHQLETPKRGFSFNQEGLLDMRMSPELSVTAKDLVNVLNEGELAELFWKFGEEKYSRRYAKAIVHARKTKPILTGNQLAQIILQEAPKRGRFDRTPACHRLAAKQLAGRHPATRVFQALRIAVNDELNCLRIALPQALRLLGSGGRLVVLSFHSLEDRIVKKFFLEEEKKGVLKIINRKPLIPTKEEVEFNPRSRSAKLRAAEKN